jgi:fucose permease
VSRHRVAPVLVIVSFLAFISLGLPFGVLGTVWPSMRLTFDRPVADLGTLLASNVGGYFFGGVLLGALTRRIGIGNVFALGAIVGSASLVAFATAPGWPALLVASTGVGLTGGLVDSVINAYVALHHGPRVMNLLHASFAIGATAGPLLVATALARGMSWRFGYVVLATLEVVLLVVALLVRRSWPAAIPAPGAARRRLGGSVIGTLGLFFVYVGVEGTAGSWSYSLLAEGRGWSQLAAGAWVAAYWGGLTGGRLLLGLLGDRVAAGSILNLSMAGSMAGALLLWLQPGGLGVVGLPILGLSLAGVFPTLVTLTPSRVGTDSTPTVIGYQIAAASLGGAALPWVAGRLVAASSLESLGPYLLGCAVAMTGLHYLVARVATAPAPAAG